MRVRGESFDVALSAVGANAQAVIPSGYAIRDIFIRNKTANAVTGGLKIGTTNGGTEVIVALGIAGNLLAPTAAAAILQRLFSAVADTTLFIQAVVAWNGALLDIVITLDKGIP